MDPRPTARPTPRRDPPVGTAARPVPLCLDDRLLLRARGGQWHSLALLQRELDEHLPVAEARSCSRPAGGTDSMLATDQAHQGWALLVADAVARLAARGLLERRTGGDGGEVRSTPRQDSRFTVDPRLEALLPRSPDEVCRLEASLLAEGCRDPLVVWKGPRLLLDGHTRYRLLSLLGRPYEVVEREFADWGAARDWVWDTHYGRRHYTALAKSYVRGRQYLASKQPHGGDWRPRCQRVTLVRKTAVAVAERYGVDARTLYRDAHLAAALDRLAQHCGEDVRACVYILG